MLPRNGANMRILIADDHPLYREALRARLEKLFPEAMLIETGSIAEIDAKRERFYDLFLLDFHMPGMSPTALKKLVTDFPAVPIAIVSGTTNAEDVRASIAAGARGFIPKTATGPHLANALQILLAGGTSVPADILLGANAQALGEVHNPVGPLAHLTTRERDVLKKLVRGLSNKEIGNELGLAEVTVKLHLRAIFRKIGARSRAEAAVMATKAEQG